MNRLLHIFSYLKFAIANVTTIGISSGLKKCLFFLLIIFSSLTLFAQTTVTYTQQQANYPTFLSNTAGNLNTGSFQFTQWANGAGSASQTVSWRKFTTTGTTTDMTSNLRSLQIGDSVVITLSCTRAYGEVGFSLLSSPSTEASWGDRQNNAAISVYQDGPDNTGSGYNPWTIKGSSTTASTISGVQGTNPNTGFINYTFSLVLTAQDRMNVYINNSSTTYIAYDVALSNTNPITDYSVYLQDDWDGAYNQNIYWGLGAVGTQHTVTNSGKLFLGNSNNSFTESYVITNGLDANSTSADSVNNLYKSGTGTLTLAAANTYTGITTISQGTLSASTIVVAGGASNLGNATTAVILGNTSTSGTLSYTGAAATYTRGFTVNAGGGGITNTTANLLTIGTGGITNAGVLTLSNTSSGGTTISSVISGTGFVIINNTGSGNTTLSAVNTYTGTTTINAGILQLGVANAIKTGNPGGGMVLNGGTFSTGATTGYLDGTSSTVNMGTLTLSNNSTIALGTGVHQIYFAVSNAASWAAGKTLTITGWVGPATGGSSGTAGQIFVGATTGTLTAPQLAQINFMGYGTGAMLLSTGELVPAITYITYYWIGGTTATNWNIAGAWSTSLGGASAGAITPNAYMIFIFDGSNIGGGATGVITAKGSSTTMDVAAIILQNNATVIINPNSATTFNIDGALSGNSLSVPLGSTLTLNSSSCSFYLKTAVTGSIAGTLNLGGGKDITINVATAGDLVFASTGVCTYTMSSSATYPFQGINGGVIFSSGSYCTDVKGSDPFGGTAANVSVFQHGSTFEFQSTTASSGQLDGKTYSNFVYNSTNTSALNQGSLGFTMDSLIVKNTTLLLTETGTCYIAGDINITSAGAIKFSNSLACTYNLNGTSQQTVVNNGSWTYGATSYLVNFNVTNTIGVVLASNIPYTQSGTFTVSSGGIFDTKTYAMQDAGTLSTFNLNSGGTLKMGSTLGITTIGATGNVETKTRIFSTSGNYVYNGITGAQVTGNALPATVSNLTINNSSNVTLTNTSITTSGVLYLTQGFLETLTNVAVVIVPSGGSVSRTNGWVYGSLQKYISGFTNFEVGDSLYYTNVSVNAVTGAGVFTVKTNVHGDHPQINSSDIDPANDENTYWTITNNAATFGSGATLVFNYPAADMDIPANATSYKLGNYNAGTWTYPLSVTAAADSLKATGITVFGGDFECGAPVCGTFGTWKGTTSTDWNVATNWCGGAIPTSTTNVVIPSVTNEPVISNANAVAASITINSGASLTMGGGYDLDISANGAFTNNAGATGFNASSSTGSVVFVGNASNSAIITGTTTFQNVTTYEGLNFGAASTINGTFNIGTNGYVLSNAPYYACNSTLLYYTHGNYNRSLEWIAGTSSSQKGYPGNVHVGNFTILNGNTGGNIGLCNNLTIDSGSALYNDYGSTGNTSLTVGANTIVNGSLSLGYNSGGDLYMYGNYTIGASASINYNTASHSSANTGGGGRALQFIGTGTQVVTNTGGGTLTVPIIVINKISGNVQLATGTNIIIPDYASTNNSLQLINTGGLDLNGQTLTMSGNTDGGHYIGILVSGGVRTITGIAGSNLVITAAAFASGVASVSVNTASGGTLITDTNVLVTANVGFAPTQYTTVNGTLELDQSGSNVGFIADGNNYPPNCCNTVSGHCIFGPASTYIMNDGGSFSRNVEWDANGIGIIGVTPGYPNNVIVSNSTQYYIGDSTVSKGIANRAMAGTLTVQPSSTLDMGTMDSGPYHLYVGGNVNINGILNLASGSSTSPTAGDIYVGGNWTRATGGVFNYNAANPRAVTFDSTTSGTITAPVSTGETFAYAYLSKTSTSAKITLADSITIVNQLGLNEGIFDLSNSNVTILSRANNTANIGTTVTPSNVSLPYSGTGRFYIERYVQAHRAWRLLTAPISSNQTINSSWQEGQTNTATSGAGQSNTVPGYGTEITNKVSIDPTPGFDKAVTNNPSILYLNNDAWATPTSTTSFNVNSEPGFMLFVRGNRSLVITTPPFNPASTTILRTKGTINVGNVSYTPPASGVQIVGNPYASETGLDSIFNSSDSLIVGSNYYVWDPLMTIDQGVGAYVSVAYAGPGTYYPTAYSSPFNFGKIESSEAFLFYFANTNPISFHETYKASSSALVFRPANQTDLQSFSFALSSINADSTVELDDGALMLFGNQYSDSVNWLEDAQKITNPSENISLVRNGKIMAIEKKQPIQVTDTIFLNITQMNMHTYQFMFVGSNIYQPGLTATLKDKFTGTSTPISLSDTNRINFTVTSNAASQGANRFMIVFQQASGGPLPVTFTSVKAWQQNSDIAVQWNVENQLNIKQYEVEKSSDGKAFTIVNTTQAKATNSSGLTYNWLDENPVSGTNYYRIASIGNNGAITYSQVVNVTIGTVNPAIAVYPNPIKDGIIGLQFSSMPAGVYGIRLINTAGQEIINTTLEHPGGSATQNIPFNPAIAKGVYLLEVIKPDNTVTSVNVIY